MHLILAIFLMFISSTSPAQESSDAGPSSSSTSEESRSNSVSFEPVLMISPAPAIPPSPVQFDEPGVAVNTLIKAVREKNWTIAASALLSLLVLLLRLWKPSMPDQYIKLSTALMATLPSIALILAHPGVGMDEVISTAIQSVLMAAGLWGLVIKDLGGKALIEKRSAVSSPPAPSTSEPAPEPPTGTPPAGSAPTG